jgi:hypothetical protein
MNNQCLPFPLRMHLFKGMNITREKKKKKKNPNIENLIKAENG